MPCWTIERPVKNDHFAVAEATATLAADSNRFSLEAIDAQRKQPCRREFRRTHEPPDYPCTQPWAL